MNWVKQIHQGFQTLDVNVNMFEYVWNLGKYINGTNKTYFCI